MNAAPPHTLIYRYPHGYFPGGVFAVSVSPPITMSGWEANNFIVKEYE